MIWMSVIKTVFTALKGKCLCVVLFWYLPSSSEFQVTIHKHGFTTHANNANTKLILDYYVCL